MNKRTLKSIVILLGVLLSGSIAFFLQRRHSPTLALDEFAQCLTSKGAVMYGAYWCPHCQKQKTIFGPSFRYITYVECTENVKKCLSEKIEGYPTWKFPDGTVLMGEQSIENLAQISGCKINGQ
jgi:thiol-disulfide isomerase/thioredoxin